MVSGKLPSSENPGSQSFISRQIDSLQPYCTQIDIHEVIGNRFLKHLKSARQISKISSNYDVIHVHYGLFAVAALIGKGRTPLVLSLMGSDLFGTVNRKGRITFITALEARLTKYLAKKCNRVIVKTDEMAKAIPAIHVDVIPNGVDLDLFCERPMNECRELLGWDEEEFYVLFPGNPSRPEKNWDLAYSSVEAAQQLTQRRITLVPLYNVFPSDVPLLINASNLVLMTSFSEGSPNVVKEALACNKHVISVNVGDVDITIGDLKGCALVGYDSYKIGSQIAYILNTISCTVRGRDRLKGLKLDLDSVAKKIIEVYTSVLTGLVV